MIKKIIVLDHREHGREEATGVEAIKIMTEMTEMETVEKVEEVEEAAK